LVGKIMNLFEKLFLIIELSLLIWISYLFIISAFNPSKNQENIEDIVEKFISDTEETEKFLPNHFMPL
jgi:hypothetical protein